MSPAAPNRARVRAAALAVVAGLLGTRAARAEDPPASAWVELSGPAVVQGLRVTDLDGDGVDDVLAVSARDVLAWRGVRDGRPAPAPTWRFEVPAAATFVAPDRPAPPAAPALLALAVRFAPLPEAGGPPVRLIDNRVLRPVPKQEERS